MRKLRLFQAAVAIPMYGFMAYEPLAAVPFAFVLGALSAYADMLKGARE